MAYDLEEQESLDQLKAWWDKWGNLVTTGVTVVCLGFAGFNGWKWYQRNEGAKATSAYVELQNALVKNDSKNIKSLSDGLIKDHSGHVFACLAAFAAANEAQKNGQLEEARDKLVWVIEKAKRAEYDAVARIRLAGVEIDLKNAKKALEILQAAKPTAGEMLAYKDRLGDVYYALGDYENARKTWTDAAKQDARGASLGALIALKLDSLPEKN